jgi:FkbH-like protein
MLANLAGRGGKIMRFVPYRRWCGVDRLWAMLATVRCLVWDLDDTLWHEGVALPSAVRTLHALDRRGILHAATGRGDHAPALARHGLSELYTAQHFGRDSAPAAVRHLASTLELPVGLLAFLAGDPVTLAEVSCTLPAVRCYPASTVERLPALADFTPPVVLPADRDRRQVARAEQRRRYARQMHAGTPASFVASLDLELEVRPAQRDDVPVAPFLRSGGRAPDPVELCERRLETGHEVVAATLRDRFGPYGVVALAVLRAEGASTALELSVSERVLSLGAAEAFVGHLLARSPEAGRRLVVEFEPTTTNLPLLLLLRFSGFTIVAKAPDRMTLAVDPLVPPPRRHGAIRVLDEAGPARAHRGRAGRGVR